MARYASRLTKEEILNSLNQKINKHYGETVDNICYAAFF